MADRRPDPKPDTHAERKTLTGADIIWKSLEALDVSCVFGYPGGAILPTYDALTRSKVHHVLVRHEQGATHMADGYARASGKVGVAMATSGPGATNMVTGIATAMMDSSPIVCITGQVGSTMIGTDAFQESDITGITLPITKHNYLITRPEEIAPALREAFQIAASDRPGPVLLDITKDAQQASCVFDWEAAAPKPHRHEPVFFPGQKDIDAALALINQAQRPVILAGHGIILSGAEREVYALAEKAGIPVALTLLGLGSFPASHPLNLGMMGMHGEAWVNQAIQEADLLIALGMRFDDRVTGKLSTYATKAKKIHIEIDRAEINKNVRVDVALIGDLREVLQQLLPGVRPPASSEWLTQIAASKKDLGRARHPEPSRQRPSLRRPRHQRAVARDQGRGHRGHRRRPAPNVGGAVLPPRTLALTDHLRRPSGHDGLRPPGLAAIGAAKFVAARRGSLGDRGRWRLVQGMTGMARTGHHRPKEKLNVKIAVINNGFLGMVRQWQQFFYDGRYASTPLLSPDYAKIADAYGIPGLCRHAARARSIRRCRPRGSIRVPR